MDTYLAVPESIVHLIRQVEHARAENNAKRLN